MKIKINGRVARSIDQRKYESFRSLNYKGKKTKKRVIEKTCSPLKAIYMVFVFFTVCYGIFCFAYQEQESQRPIETVEAKEPERITSLQEDFESADIPAWTDYFDKHFGDKADEARRVAKCESNMRPEAFNKHKNGEDRGIMQIWDQTWKHYTDLPFSEAFDEETNIQIAKKIYDQRGWQPWLWSSKCHGLR